MELLWGKLQYEIHMIILLSHYLSSLTSVSHSEPETASHPSSLHQTHSPTSLRHPPQYPPTIIPLIIHKTQPHRYKSPSAPAPYRTRVETISIPPFLPFLPLIAPNPLLCSSSISSFPVCFICLLNPPFVSSNQLPIA